jgi:hypothetical protein
VLFAGFEDVEGFGALGAAGGESEDMTGFLEGGFALPGLKAPFL